ncbi:putative beta-glucosidase G [Cryomyces minteri]|uniref:Probable beta-glucosidase G n=1 Tax=Cryomyces minteri TaxID=331657 RepID=A0A4U0W0K4_9PEZI|nr:putative beta-glucosidase G [Cryomyces minteri]
MSVELAIPVLANTTGAGGWQNALSRANAFVSQLTLEEKARMVTGTTGPCVGNIAPIPRVGFNGLCLHDGPLAIREAVYASVFPAGVTTAASWDRGLMHQRGIYMGEEFRGKGAHVALGPVAGPLGRSPYGGRNWEGFSPDPYLTGVAMEETITGMQSTGIQACAKHYIGNEQETQRNPSTTTFGTSTSQNGPVIEAVSANIDDRTMHKLYLWPFANAVRAGSAAVMCSYNRINGSYGCENSKALNGLLKDELGFQGYVMSDWLGTHSGVSAVGAGLDMNMPGGINFLSPTPSYWGENITIAVNNGSLAESRIDDMIRRIMTPYFYLGQDQGFPTVDPSGVPLNFFPPSTWVAEFDLNGTSNRDVRANHAGLIRELGAAGTVLLKNINNALPLRAPKNIAVFGNDAGDLTRGLYFLNIFAGVGSGNEEFGTLPVGGGSGTGRFSYVVPPLEAIKAREGRNGALVQYVLDNRNITDAGLWSIAPSPPDVCLVFLKTWASEGSDRTHLEADWNSTAVVNTVAATCNNTVVITHSGGVNTLPFASNPNVTAILAAHYPGQETGNSIVDVLYGDVNPSGHLPYTIARSTADYNVPITNSSALLNTTDPNAWQSDFTERLLIDYRHFDATNASVLIVDVLYGDVNPSGHLPYTIARSTADYNVPITNSSALLNTTDPNAWQSDFTERLLIDYRHFDATNASVLYEFGFGLSYTTFGLSGSVILNQSGLDGLLTTLLSGLGISNVYGGANGSIPRTPPPGAVLPGGNQVLWDVLYRVTATVQNTGSVAGAAVPQLYLSMPAEAGEGTPVRVLRGFAKVSVQPGQSVQVRFDLMRRDVSYWDARRQDWVIPNSEIGVSVGFSSRDLRLNGGLRA